MGSPAGGLLSLAAAAVHGRQRVALAREERRTMTALTDLLTTNSQPGQVAHRDPSGRKWTITLGVPAAPVTPEHASGDTCR